MCGRFVSSMEPAELAQYLGIDEIRTEAIPPSWNVAPTDPVYAAAENKEGRRLLGTYKWGLVPSWADDPKVASRMINARAETVADKFGPALSRRRCLVPAAGFYEWERLADGTKRPWFITRADGEPLVFAGLWEVWRPKDAGDDVPLLRTCTIITTGANDTVARLHDRMPVVLDARDWDRWLDRSLTDVAAVSDLLRPASDGVIAMKPASTRVNSVKNNGPDLLVAD